MENLKPNENRARTITIMFWILIGLQVISLGSNYFQYDLYSRYNSGVDIDTSQFTSTDNFELILSLLYIAVYITCIITFIQWFRRAYFNLHTRVNDLQYGEGWAAGAWFVPILNLFRPYQIMKELYDETDILLTRKLHDYRNRLSSDFIGLWWTFWLISSFVDKITFRYSMDAVTVDDMMTSLIINMVSLAIGVPLTLMAIKVVNDYAKVEPLLTEVNSEVDEFGTSSLKPQPIF